MLLCKTGFAATSDGVRLLTAPLARPMIALLSVCVALTCMNK